MEIIKKVILDGKVNLAITEKGAGSWHPKREDFEAKLSELFSFTRHDNILFPQLGMTNDVCFADGLSAGIVREFPGHDGVHIAGFLRSTYKADAGVTPLGLLPLAVCNADCPVMIATTTPDKRGNWHMVMAHLGLMAMISKDKRSSVLAEVVSRLAEREMALESAWIGFGAGPCCYGLSDGDDRWPVIMPWQHRVPSVLKGPRKGQGAVNLAQIASNQLFQLGLASEKIEIDDYCTCCAGGRTEDGPHWSNLLRHGPTARNAVIAWGSDILYPSFA